MKYYAYHEYGQDDLIIKSEDDIISEYWDYWCDKVRKVNRDHLISRENCIDDWVVVNWAWEIDEC